jgi:DNA-binding XRE family transcriptional regulator
MDRGSAPANSYSAEPRHDLSASSEPEARVAAPTIRIEIRRGRTGRDGFRERSSQATMVQAPETDVRKMRLRTGLSQAQFATKFGFPPATLRNWEQGRSGSRVGLVRVPRHAFSLERPPPLRQTDSAFGGAASCSSISSDDCAGALVCVVFLPPLPAVTLF